MALTHTSRIFRALALAGLAVSALSEGTEAQSPINAARAVLRTHSGSGSYRSLALEQLARSGQAGARAALEQEAATPGTVAERPALLALTRAILPRPARAALLAIARRAAAMVAAIVGALLAIVALPLVAMMLALVARAHGETAWPLAARRTMHSVAQVAQDGRHLRLGTANIGHHFGHDAEMARRQGGQCRLGRFDRRCF